MGEDGPRLSKMKLAYKRAIQEVLKEQERVRKILSDSISQPEDSFFVNSSRAGDTFQEQDPEAVSKAVEEVFQSLKSKLSDLFRRKLAASGLDTKLNQLDKDISEDRTSPGDITSEEYIREIFESYLVDSKMDYMEYLEQGKMESLARMEALRAELDMAREEMRVLKEENSSRHNSYTELIHSLSETIATRRNPQPHA